MTPPTGRTPPLRPDQVTLAVLAKAPRPGRVKTRLCPPCTPEQAAEVAAAALRDTLDVVAAARLPDAPAPVLVLDGPPPDWVPAGFRVLAQRGDGLDQRLGHAFADVSAPTLLVGMDTPQIRADGLRSLTGLLCRPGTDAVVGPAPDGGFWAIGLRQGGPDHFDGVPMSRPDTCAAQLRRLRELGLAVRLGGHLRDVDHFEDAVAVAATVPGTRFAGTVSRLVELQPAAPR